MSHETKSRSGGFAQAFFNALGIFLVFCVFVVACALIGLGVTPEGDYNTATVIAGIPIALCFILWQLGIMRSLGRKGSVSGLIGYAVSTVVVTLPFLVILGLLFAPSPYYGLFAWAMELGGAWVTFALVAPQVLAVAVPALSLWIYFRAAKARKAQGEA